LAISSLGSSLLETIDSAIRKSRLTFFRAGGLIAALPYSQTQT
jgi:hypothetical protein